jgi:hypothetical protein
VEASGWMLRIFGPGATRGHDVRDSHPSYIQNLIWGDFSRPPFKKWEPSAQSAPPLCRFHLISGGEE